MDAFTLVAAIAMVVYVGLLFRELR